MAASCERPGKESIEVVVAVSAVGCEGEGLRGLFVVDFGVSDSGDLARVLALRFRSRAVVGDGMPLGKSQLESPCPVIPHQSRLDAEVMVFSIEAEQQRD